MRINKFLANCNLGSRRQVEELVRAGQIKVNKKICTNLATQISEQDVVEYKNKILKPENEKIYLALNKPTEYLCTKKDSYGRKTIYEFLPLKYRHLKYVGRLDYNSEGLLLLTNDGDWANQITHPRYKLPKTYEVILNKPLNQNQLQKLRDGIMIENKKTLPAQVREVSKMKLDITIFEGRKRQIRLMIQAVGSGIYNLKRIQIGKLELGNLALGKYKIIRPQNLT